MSLFPREPLFSSASEEWETPPAFYDFVNREFSFELDAAATPRNAKCDRFLTKVEDGLVTPWNCERVWLNPPYGRGIIAPWMQRAALFGGQGATVVCLVHARTDTAFWHNFVMAHAREIRFVRGRLKFLDMDKRELSGATFPSVLVVFSGKRSTPWPLCSAVDWRN